MSEQNELIPCNSIAEHPLATLNHKFLFIYSLEDNNKLIFW